MASPSDRAPASDPGPSRWSRRRRRALWSALGLVLLLAVGLGGLVWMVSSRAGARFSVDRISQLVPGELAVAAVEGPVRGPLTLRGVRYETERFIVEIAEVRLDWNLGQLRRRLLDVSELSARGVTVRILPSEEAERRELHDINLRYNVVLRALRLEQVAIYRPGEPAPVVIERLLLTTGSWRDAVRIEEVDVLSPHFDLEAGGWLKPEGDYPLDVRVAWSYRPPEDVAARRPAVRGRGRLAGTLRALRLDQRLEQPFTAHLVATVAEPLFAPRFRGRVTFSDLAPRAFAADSPITRAAGTLAIEGTGAADFRASGEVRVATAEWGEADSEFRLRRDGTTWRFDPLQLRRPGAAGRATWTGVVVVGDDHAEPRAEGRLAWQQLTWPLDGADPAVRSARGSVVVEGTVEGYTLVGSATLSFPEVPPGDYELTARGDRRGLVLDSVAARALGGRIAAQGRVRWEPRVHYSVQATGRGLQPQLAWPAVPAALAGGTWRFTGSGDAEDLTIERLHIDNERGTLAARGTVGWEPAVTWKLDAETRGIGPGTLWPEVPEGLTGGNWRVSGSGSDRGAELSQVAGDFLGGRVEGAGSFTWEPATSWRFAGTARGVDPARAFPGWPGALAADFRTAGTERAGGLDGEVVVERLEGTLRDRQLAGHGTVTLRGEAVALDRVAATWGPADLRLDGRISPTYALAFHVRELELGALHGDAAGVIEARGEVAGDPDRPRLAATLAGEGLAWGEHRAATLSGRATVDLAAGGTIDVDLIAGDLRVGPRGLEQARLQVAGSRERHQLAASASGEQASFTLAAAGSLDGIHPDGAVEPSRLSWTGTVTRLDADSPETGAWRLAEPVALHLATGDLHVDRLCWLSGAARLCADVDWHEGTELALAATLEDLPLRLLEPLLPADLEVAGTLDGSARLRTLRDGALLGEAALRPAPGAALWDEQRGEEVRLVLESGQVRLLADPAALRATLQLVFRDTGTARGELTLPGFRLGREATAQPLAGRIAVRFDDLRFVEALIPELGATGGVATAELELSGSLGDPAVQGAGKLSGARAALPRFGLRLEQIELEARGTGSGPLQLSGSLRSGPGTLRFRGSSPLLPRPGEPLRLELEGTRVEAIDVDEAYVLADPRLDVVYDGRLVRVAGLVVVPEARIDYQGDEREVVTPSRDVVFVGGEQPAPLDRGLAIAGRVRIVLGEEVELSALGLETELAGSLLVIEEPGAATTGSGELELESGTFKAYGQDLTIDHGRLFFAGGPLSDPGIDLRAHRTIPEAQVTAGIHARGTLRAPQVTLWSDPAMGDSQVLSYLLLGRPLEAARPEEGSLLANAATSLGVRGGNLLARKLGAQLGLEEARIEAGDDLEQAAFVVGKYLSPRLYVSYGIGLFNAVNTLRIRYLVSEKLHLQAETGASTSGDVLYTFERGRPKPEEIGEHLYQDLPRVPAEELATPPKVPVGSEGPQPPGSGKPVEPVAGGEAEPDR